MATTGYIATFNKEVTHNKYRKLRAKVGSQCHATGAFRIIVDNLAASS